MPGSRSCTQREGKNHADEAQNHQRRFSIIYAPFSQSLSHCTAISHVAFYEPATADIEIKMTFMSGFSLFFWYISGCKRLMSLGLLLRVFGATKRKFLIFWMRPRIGRLQQVLFIDEKGRTANLMGTCWKSRLMNDVSPALCCFFAPLRRLIKLRARDLS